MTWKPSTETNFVLDDAAETFATFIEQEEKSSCWCGRDLCGHGWDAARQPPRLAEERNFGVCDSHIGTKVPHEPSENCLNWRPVDWPKPPALTEPEEK